VDSDDDGMLDRDGELLSLTMVFAPWNQMADVAQLIQSQWRDLGIDLELIQVPDFTSLLEYANEGNYDLIAMSDFSVEASVLNSFYLSDGPRNWSGLSDAELDNWLREAVRQVAPDSRAVLYLSIQQRVMEQAAVLPIREYVNLNGATARLDGVIFSAQGWWPLLRNFQLAP
jgi:peptide/nickel transport system substrate-binding protein